MKTRLPASERKSQILKTAAELFSQQGYEGTKTSQIAREAGVNEAIIFRHFTNKEELYWAVLMDSCSCFDIDEEVKGSLAADHDPESVLCNMAETLLKRLKERPQLHRLLLFAGLENHKLSHRFFRQFSATRYEMLADYIRAQVRRGNFRSDLDPLLAARGFIAMLIYHFQIQELFGGKNVQDYDIRTVATTFVKLWLGGMQANSAYEPAQQQRELAARSN
jgi:AcrR family transcriptional regulator